MVRWTATVDDQGKVRLDDEASFRRYCTQFAKAKVEITVGLYQPVRSDAQNKYWHGVVVPTLAEFCGYDHEEMHQALKAQFLAGKTEAGLPTIRSTRDLSRQEFVELVERVCRWAAEDLGCVIPPPR